MKNFRIIFLAIFFLVSIIDSQNLGSASVGQQIPITIQPVAVDPVATDPIGNLNIQTPNQDVQIPNTQSQVIVEKDPSTQLKEESIQNKDIIAENINVQPIDPNLNPDPRENRQANLNYNQQAEKAILEERERIRREKQQQIQTEGNKRSKEEAMRSARYKAQQERLNQLRNKRQIYEKKKKAQMESGEKVEYKNEEKYVISETEKTRTEEKKKMREILREQLNVNDQKYSYQTAFFEVHNQVEEYLLRPSSDMTINLRVTIYVSKDNVYSFVSDVAETQPVRIYVYQDNKNIIGQISCYFEGALKFQAKGGSVYSVKIFNARGSKLISFSYPKFITTQTASKFISSQKGKSQFIYAKGIMDSIQNSMIDMQRTRFIDLNNANMLGKSMKRYFGYQIIQIIVVGIVCYFQVYLIKNMLKNPSIV